MKKLFSSIIIVMMIALAFTLVASATQVYTPDADGLYTIDYEVTADDGTQFGMVVIETTGEEAFALDETTIRYIDQVGAEDGTIAFDAFAPMDLKSEGTYKVYIGGGDLVAAEFIGTLGAAEEAPVVTSVTIDQTAPTVEEGATITLTATVVDADAEYTLAWASDATDVATVDSATGVVTGVKAGTANITVTAAEGVTATVEVTVTAVAEEAVLGDVDGDGTKNANDAIRLLRHISLPALYPVSYTGSKDFNKDETVSSADAVYLLRHISLPALYPISW